jgi:hypothetical protein
MFSSVLNSPGGLFFPIPNPQLIAFIYYKHTPPIISIYDPKPRLFMVMSSTRSLSSDPRLFVTKLITSIFWGNCMEKISPLILSVMLQRYGAAAAASATAAATASKQCHTC